MKERIYEQYFRQNRLPHLWCPGCGNGIVMKAIVEAVVKQNLDPDKTVIVSGIGCSSRASGYMDFDTLHTAHGRAIPFATGIKLARPELNVIVITGDGDCMAIGGNHFIHGARRNVDLTVVLFNNNIYGMTGGQASPTTPLDKKRRLHRTARWIIRSTRVLWQLPPVRRMLLEVRLITCRI